MGNLIFTEDNITTKMAEKKAMLDNIASQLGSNTSLYVRMTLDDYLDATIDPSKVYYVLDDDNGNYGLYKNRNWCKGYKVISPWLILQNQVRSGTFSQNYNIGDQLTVKYNGNDTAWDIVAIDVAIPADTSKTHSVTLMPHNLLEKLMFDNPEPSNSDSGRRNYGNNRYLHSNIRTWLNSSAVAGSWWLSQHKYDAPPDYSSIKDGFMSYFESDFLNVIGETKIKVANNNVTDGGRCEELVDKFYLPSATEVGLANENNIAEGALFPYFSSNARRIKSESGDGACDWWLRTPSSSYSRYVRSVSSSGALDYYVAYSANGVAPVCNII
jgi:hypothetical protein